MPILKGTLGYTRFLVKCPQPLPPSQIAEKLNMFRFRPLHPHGEDTESVGWCPFLWEYDAEKSIAESDFHFDQNIVLCLRLDSITLPKALLRATVKKALSAYATEHKRLPDKTVKKEIELAETLSLRSRVLPATKIIESLWCQDTGELRIFSRSRAQVDRFLDLFQTGFLLRPERRDFAHSAWQCADERNWLSDLTQLNHHPIFLPPVRIDVQ
ncbi:MAG TPA: recombination-associated protein RdgC [Myxococcota bacterium]|nr:recombination-associated protein RdgC [Myxococcota bacterium]